MTRLKGDRKDGFFVTYTFDASLKREWKKGALTFRKITLCRKTLSVMIITKVIAKVTE